MREFLNPNPKSPLASLLWETKFIYTVFLLFMLAAYIVMGLMIAGRTGFDGKEISEHYLGNEHDPNADEFKYPRDYKQMMETTHFHIYSIPLLIFVQGHLFMLCAWRRKWKVAIVSAAFAGAALQIGAPWMVRYCSGDFHILVQAGRALLLLCFLIFTFVPLIEMWRVKDHRSLAN